MAVICPIFNKGDPVDVANYGPVSLTSVVCKDFERILKRAILSFLIQLKALTSCQHGFLLHRSGLSNLLILEERITRLMDDGNTAEVECKLSDELPQETWIKIEVHQGSVIGPLLFLLFVGDLPSVINFTSQHAHKATVCRDFCTVSVNWDR